MTSEAGRFRGAPESHSLRVLGVDNAPPPEGEAGEGRLLLTDGGSISCLLHQAPEGEAAVVWVWGILGGFAGPAGGIYGRLAETLKERGIASLRVSYREPRVFERCVEDVLAGVSFLEGLGRRRIALVGHSLGGAVVISAAPKSPAVVAVVGLSSQTAGAKGAALVSPRSMLLVHGLADRHLSPMCSELIHDWALPPKELVLYQGAGHELRQCREELDLLLTDWLTKRLHSADSQ